MELKPAEKCQRIVCIQQPAYLPWMGFFEQIATSDVFVLLDSVQFVRRYWQSRNRLKTVAGSPFWLTVPTERAPVDTEISDIRICDRDRDWRKKHLQSIRLSLGRAPYFQEYFPFLEYWLMRESTLLADINIALIQEISKLLRLQTHFVRSSDLDVIGKKTELMLNICQSLGATKYYSAARAAEYMDETLFLQSGIELKYQDWTHPEYRQVSTPFVSHLSIVDALMNIGADATRALILD
jgi:hypothetical protein